MQSALELTAVINLVRVLNTVLIRAPNQPIVFHPESNPNMASRKSGKKSKKSHEEAFDYTLRHCESMLVIPKKPMKLCTYEFHYNPVTGVQNHKSCRPYMPALHAGQTRYK